MNDNLVVYTRRKGALGFCTELVKDGRKRTLHGLDIIRDRAFFCRCASGIEGQPSGSSVQGWYIQLSVDTVADEVGWPGHTAESSLRHRTEPKTFWSLRGDLFVLRDELSWVASRLVGRGDGAPWNLLPE